MLMGKGQGRIQAGGLRPQRSAAGQRVQNPVKGENTGREGENKGADREDAETPHKTSAQGKDHKLPLSTAGIHPFLRKNKTKPFSVKMSESPTTTT